MIAAGIGAVLLVGIVICFLVFGHAPQSMPPLAQPTAILPPAPVEIAPMPPPAAAAPSTEIQATDFATLLAIASDPKNPLAFKSITVVGIPDKTHMTGSGNMRLSFKGTEEQSGFVVFCPDTILPAMQEKFGGVNGAGILNHQVAVQGVVALVKGHPQIRVESADQIRRVKSTETSAGK